MQTNSKTILVTGGAGFLGSHLCEYLLSRKHIVYCVDNLYSSSISNIEHLIGQQNFYFLEEDITNDFVRKLDNPNSITIVYNLACPASPVHYQRDPVQTVKTSVLGTINCLELAKRNKAILIHASTSEVYGDPLVHPQSEEYWGNVNPIGPRSCYDEGKRVAETLCRDYRIQYKVDARIMRLFNSLTADQQVVYYLNDVLFVETFEECWKRVGSRIDHVKVPCFDRDGGFHLRQISGIHKHRVRKDIYKISTTWGKSVSVTQDHGLFRRDIKGFPEPVFAHELKKEDWIAVPKRLPFIEKPIVSIDLQTLFGNQLNAAEENKVRLGSTGKSINSTLTNIDDLLWFLGFYLAEGCVVDSDQNRTPCSYKGKKHRDWCLLLSSNTKYLEKAIGIIHSVFDLKSEIKIQWSKRAKGNMPFIALRSKIIVKLVCEKFGFGYGLAIQKDIPNWILQLPSAQLCSFVYGFWQGDGNHDAKTTGKSVIFNSSSSKIIEKLNLILLRFGITPSHCSFRAKVSKDSIETFPAYRLTVNGLLYNDILRFPEEKQNCFTKAHLPPDFNEVKWAKIKSIKVRTGDEDVYDFSVPEAENFVGGSLGICCHNTYGPRLARDDGRVVSNFILQALADRPLTIYGDGSQTRSFTYVDDWLRAAIAMFGLGQMGPINIGNPSEFTIKELAEKIILKTNSKSTLCYEPLPKDDPKQRKPDITKAKRLLQWEPRIDLDKGLDLTIQFYKDQNNGLRSR